MAVHIDVAIPVRLHPKDIAYFTPVIGMALDIPEAGLDLGEVGFIFMLCFRLDSADMNKPTRTQVTLRDPDGKVVASSPEVKPPVKASPYDGVGNGWVLHPLKGFKVKENGRYTVQSFINGALVKETVFSIEKPSKGEE